MGTGNYSVSSCDSLSDKARGVSAKPLAAWNHRQRELKATGGGPSLLVAGWGEDIAARWDRAWSERFAFRLVGTWRDAAYLRWRYVDHPRFDYAVRFAEDRRTGSLKGLLVYRVETVQDRSEKVMRVLEFLADEDAGRVLSASLVKAGEDAGVAFADFYCTSSDLAGPLEAAGFVHEETLPERLPGLFQPLDHSRTGLTGAFWVNPGVSQDSRALLQSPSLYFTRSDCDQDRPN